MITLQITPQKEAALNAIEDLSMKVVKKALKGEIGPEDDQVKIAVATLSLVAKNRQIATKRDSFEFAVAVSTATEEQLAKYIEVTSPKIHKALGKSDTIIESEVAEEEPAEEIGELPEDEPDQGQDEEIEELPEEPLSQEGQFRKDKVQEATERVRGGEAQARLDAAQDDIY